MSSNSASRGSARRSRPSSPTPDRNLIQRISGRKPLHGFPGNAAETDTRDRPMTRITNLRVFDLRFPTSASLDGSDAMNPDPDYSAAYVILETDRPGLAGHGLTFTIGRGNDICCMAIEAMRHLVVGVDLAEVRAAPGKFWRHLTGDSQLRWIGPDKGAMHLATGAVVNAFWDALAKEAGLPVWKFVSTLSPEEIADIVDYRYITDALTRDEALDI